MANNNPIGFFDSGVGQISILREIQKLLPNESYIVLADEKHLPFGEKSKEAIETFTGKAASFLISNYKIKILVVACNTASVQALAHIRKYFEIPVIGTVPAIKPAFLKSKNKRIAILATTATIKSDYLQNLISIYAPGAEILKIACPGLEEAIEKRNVRRINLLISAYATKIQKDDCDTVILGCTHYPLVKAAFKKLLPKGTLILDSSLGIAKKVRSDLTNMKALSSDSASNFFFTTGDADSFSQACSHYLKSKVRAEKITL
jgi:glutamate racemase